MILKIINYKEGCTNKLKGILPFYIIQFIIQYKKIKFLMEGKIVMETKKYYKIKEIADKAGVTIRTLRYYDKIELLKPSYKNDLNYRFYTDADLIELQKIISLKFLGFSIIEIKEIREVNKSEQTEMLKKKKRLLEQKIKNLNFINDSLSKIEHDLNINIHTDIDWCSIASEIKNSRIENHKASFRKEIKDKKKHRVLHSELSNVLIKLLKRKNINEEEIIIEDLKKHMNKMVNGNNGLEILIDILEDVIDIPGHINGLTSSNTKALIDIITHYID